MELNVVIVSLKRELPLIKVNIKNFIKIYSEYKIKFKLICPKKEIRFFKKIKNCNIEIISENNLVNKKYFKDKFLFYYRKKNNSFINKRINWYYSQALKIIYVLSNSNHNNLLWESDSIIIKKINFLEENKKYSVNYGNLYEFHLPYFITNKIILKKIPNKFFSNLNLFSFITIAENLYITKKLQSYISNKNNDIGLWIIKLMAKSIYENKEKDKSLFADYELLNIIKLLKNKKKQKIVKFFRRYLNGYLSNNQIKLLRILNYKFITYEYYHRDIKKNSTFFKTKQPWFQFLKIITTYEMRVFKNYYEWRKKIKLLNN